MPGRNTAAALLDGSMVEALSSLKAGSVSARALTEAALERAERVQTTHNAFIEIWPERALAEADRLDGIPHGARGVLHGIPMAHKDCFAIRGRPPTVGSTVELPREAPNGGTAAAIQSLEAAGAVTIGALNLSEMVAGPTGQNPHFGDCRNSWNTDYISGGSSSGSAVAVTTGAVFASLGSDTGGSIRLPASANGCIGLKPSYGLLPLDLTFPRAPTLDCIGPLTRSAHDAMIVTAVVAGSSRVDIDCWGALLPFARITRVGVIDDGVVGDLDASVAARTDDAVACLAERLNVVKGVQLPHLSLTYAMGDAISKVEASTLHGRAMGADPSAYSHAVYTRTEPGFHIPAQRYAEALLLRGRILGDVLKAAFDTCDVLVCPTIPVEIPTREAADMEKGDAVFKVVAGITPLTRPFSYLGLPAVSVPVGADSSGLPIGLQIIGRPYGERRVLAVARTLMADLGRESVLPPNSTS